MKLKISIFTQKQLQEILYQASQLDQKKYMIVKTLSETGMRISELVSFTVNNINVEEQYIQVVGKRDKIRNIDISPLFANELNAYIKLNKIKGGMRIFKITRASINNFLKTIEKTVGSYYDIYPHKFRHTYAVNLLRLTKNIRYVQSQLGHSRLETTAEYLRFFEFDEEKSQLSNLYQRY